MLDRGMQAKLKILRQYPDMGMFVVRTYYEKDPTVSEYIQNSYQTYLKEKADLTFSNLDPKQFIREFRKTPSFNYGDIRDFF